MGGTLGVYTGSYRLCDGTPEPSLYPISGRTESPFIKTAKRMGAPYRNPIAGFRKALNCNYRDCSGVSSSGSSTSNWNQNNLQILFIKITILVKKVIVLLAADPFPDNGCGCCPTDCSSGKIVHRSGIQARTHRPIVTTWYAGEK